MRVCLIGYIDRTDENAAMLEAYEFRNDFWAERIKFRRKDGHSLADGELERVSDWVNREIVGKHRTNWLSERQPAYADITDAEELKKYWPWMNDGEIRQRLDREAVMRAIFEEFPPEEFRRQYLAEPVIHNDGSRQLELEFK